tara:strand:- start:82 stop:372 length:291 start_codon:yes stop_codon:yes gene_type:complete
MLDLENKSHEKSIVELLEELFDVYKGNDWLIVKKYIVRYSHPDVRKYFSTRNLKTRKHTMNDFEKKLVNFCSNNYKKDLSLSIKDAHTEKDTVNET